MLKTTTVKSQSFFGMNYTDVFTETNIFTEDLRKSALTENPTPIPEIDLVYVLSARTTALSQIADVELLEQNKRQEREFDLMDDIHRMRLGIDIAIQVCALRARKNPDELTDHDYVIPIFYNGRSIHNEDLKMALRNPEIQKQLGKAPLPYYPARLFNISAIYNPRKNTIGQNTLGQAQSFRNYLEYHSHKHIAVVSSAFHLPRVGRALGIDSPQMDETLVEQEIGFSLQDIKLYLYGVHKNEARNGMAKDLIGEKDNMQKYSSEDTLSISRYQSNNVFFTDVEIFSSKSLAKAIFWDRRANDAGNDLEDELVNIYAYVQN